MAGGVRRLGLVRGWCLSSGRKSREGRAVVLESWMEGLERGRLREGFRVVVGSGTVSSIASRFGFLVGGSWFDLLDDVSTGLEMGGFSLFDGGVCVSVLFDVTGLLSLLFGFEAWFCEACCDTEVKFGVVDDLGRTLEASMAWTALFGDRSGILYFGATGGTSTSRVSILSLFRCGFIVSGFGTGILDSRSGLGTLEAEATLIGLTGDGGEVGE